MRAKCRVRLRAAPPTSSDDCPVTTRAGIIECSHSSAPGETPRGYRHFANGGHEALVPALVLVGLVLRQRLASVHVGGETADHGIAQGAVKDPKSILASPTR